MPKNIVLKISQKGAAKTGKALKAVTGSVARLGAKSALVGAGFAVLSTKLAGDFQKSLLEVSTLMTNVNSKTLPNMSRELRAVASASGLALSSISKAKYDIVSAGFSDAAESANVLAVASKLAVGGVTTAASAADILTTSLNAYGKTADEVNDVSDVLFTTVRLGKTTMNELSQSLGMVLPFAKSMNLSMRGVGAAMATLTASGINTAEATTALRASILGLSAPADGARDAMKAAGIEVVRFADGTVDIVETVKQFQGMDPATIKKFIPNVRAITGIQTLANNFNVLSKNVEQFETQAAGATEIAFGKMNTAFNTQFSKLKNNMQNIMITVGDVIIDNIQPSIERANAEFTKLGDIGWDIVGATLKDNSSAVFNLVSQTFDIAARAIEMRIKLVAMNVKNELASIIPWSEDNSEAIAAFSKQIETQSAKDAKNLSKSWEVTYQFLVDQAEQRGQAEAKISKEISKQGSLSAEEIEKAFVRTDGALRRVVVTTEDINRAFEMIGMTMEKVAVPDIPEGKYTQHIDFVTGMGIAFTNSGEKSQMFWDNLTTGMQSSTDRTSAYVGGVSSLFENMYARKKQLLDNDMNAEIKRTQMSFDRQKESIINSFTVNGQLTEQGQKKLQELEIGHNSSINNIKEDFRQKEIDAQRKLKPIKYAQAISGTASAVVGALGNKPWTPLNFTLAGLVAAAGAAEIATIASQPFAQGGIVPGSGNRDTVPAMLTPGEVILNQSQQENLVGGMGGITINVGKFIGSQENADELANIIEERARLGFNRIAVS